MKCNIFRKSKFTRRLCRAVQTFFPGRFLLRFCRCIKLILNRIGKYRVRRIIIYRRFYDLLCHWVFGEIQLVELEYIAPPYDTEHFFVREPQDLIRSKQPPVPVPRYDGTGESPVQQQWSDAPSWWSSPAPTYRRISQKCIPPLHHLCIPASTGYHSFR